jgi:hypothetical protein
MSINNATPSDWDRVCDKELEDVVNSPSPSPSHYNSDILPRDARERKAIPVYTGFINYFPRAITAVSRISLIGGLQHGQTAETLHWDRSKSGDELDAMMRHILDEDWAQVAWRAMANLEKKEEAKAEAEINYRTTTFHPSYTSDLVTGKG